MQLDLTFIVEVTILLLRALVVVDTSLFEFREQRAGGCVCSAAIRTIRTLNLHSMCACFNLLLANGYLIFLAHRTCIPGRYFGFVPCALFVLGVWDVAAPWT